LPRNGLVVWTAGNVSQRVPGSDLFVIKPSGVSYDELTADVMVVCELDGTKIEDGTSDRLQPSSDTAAHAYVYRHMPEVGGVVHTHSPYATAWAALGEPIPCVLTMMADEFGGPIPVGPCAIIGGDSSGRGSVGTWRESRSPAVLMRNHGPFTRRRGARGAAEAAGTAVEAGRPPRSCATTDPPPPPGTPPRPSRPRPCARRAPPRSTSRASSVSRSRSPSTTSTSSTSATTTSTANKTLTRPEKTASEQPLR